MSNNWKNFLSLVPATLATLLATCVAFLRFYDETDFKVIGWIAHPRAWSNGFTVAAIVAALANFGVEWNRRNRETDRLAEEEQRRAEEKQRRSEDEARRVAQERAEAKRREEEEERREEEEERRSEEEARRVAQERAEATRRAEDLQQAAQERERAARRARIEARCRAAQIRFQLDPNETNRQGLIDSLVLIEEYGDTL